MVTRDLQIILDELNKLNADLNFDKLQLGDLIKEYEQLVKDIDDLLDKTKNF